MIRFMKKPFWLIYYACMYICIYVYMYTRTHSPHVYVCIYTFKTYTYVQLHTFIHDKLLAEAVVLESRKPGFHDGHQARGSQGSSTTGPRRKQTKKDQNPKGESSNTIRTLGFYIGIHDRGCPSARYLRPWTLSEAIITAYSNGQ